MQAAMRRSCVFASQQKKIKCDRKAEERAAWVHSMKIRITSYLPPFSLPHIPHQSIVAPPPGRDSQHARQETGATPQS